MLDDEEVTAPEAAEEPDPQVEEEVEASEETEETSEEEVTEEPEVEEVLDPGQFEGMSAEQREDAKKDANKEHEPPFGHKRYKQVYKEGKDFERENIKLKKQMAEMEKKPDVVPEQKETTLQEPVKEESKAPDENLIKLKELRVQRKQAKVDMEEEKEADIQDQIEDLIMAIQNDKQKIDKSAITAAMQEEREATAAEGFKKRNTWFNENSPDYNYMKRGAAIAAEQELGKTFKGSYSDLLMEVEKVVNEQFSPPQQKKQRVSAVAGVGAVRQPAPSKGNELSNAEKRIAHGLFGQYPNPEEMYANSKIEQSGGKI